MGGGGWSAVAFVWKLARSGVEDASIDVPAAKKQKVDMSEGTVKKKKIAKDAQAGEKTVDTSEGTAKKKKIAKDADKTGEKAESKSNGATDGFQNGVRPNHSPTSHICCIS